MSSVVPFRAHASKNANLSVSEPNLCLVAKAHHFFRNLDNCKWSKTGPIKRSFGGAILRREGSPSVPPSAEMSFRGAVDVLESYRIDEFRTHCEPFLYRSVLDASHNLTSSETHRLWPLTIDRELKDHALLCSQNG